MRANEFIDEDSAISLRKLGKFHKDNDVLADFVPERLTHRFALHPDKWESTFFSLTNKDPRKLKYFSPEKIDIPSGTLVGDMAIANKFYRSKSPEEQEQYAQEYKQSLKPYPVDVNQYRMPELLIPKQGVAEGSEKIIEYRDRMYQYLKSIVPGFPDYVVKDWLYANFARGATQGPNWSFDTIGKDIPNILKDMGLSVDTKWQLVPNMKFTMDMWEPKTLKRLQARAGGSSKSTEPDVHIPARDAERHATQAQLAQQQGGVRKEPVILIKTSNGYELLEGWHRTIQHFAKYPNGYTGPAYVAVAQNQQGVTEDATINIPTIGINVRSDGNIDYASLIVDGKKKYESRRTDSLRPYVGKTVGIVRTGNGPAVAIGQVTIGEPIEVDVGKFNKLRNQHLVPQGSKFDIESDSTKYLYPMINPVRWDNEKPIKSKGIVSRKIDEAKLSVDVPNEDWLQEKIDYAKSKGRNSFGVPYFGSTTAYVRGTPPQVRVMRLASLPGMKNEQLNVRKNDLKWLMDYMETNKKLPPKGSNSDEEYLPYIMVAYNGEAWVNEGNHRIMAAYRLNWQTMPIELRYFDGGERVKSGDMYPEKIGLSI